MSGYPDSSGDGACKTEGNQAHESLLGQGHAHELGVAVTAHFYRPFTPRRRDDVSSSVDLCLGGA